MKFAIFLKSSLVFHSFYCLYCVSIVSIEKVSNYMMPTLEKLEPCHYVIKTFPATSYQ